MADDKDRKPDLAKGESAKPGATDTATPKRPAITIDAKATVIETRDIPGSSGPAASAAKAGTASDPDGGKDRKPAAEAAPAAAVAPASTQRRGGFLSHVAAGVVGALMALFGVDLGSRVIGTDIAPGLSPSNRIAVLQERIATLEADVQEKQSGADVLELKDRLAAIAAETRQVAALKAQVGALEAAQRSAAAAAAKLEARLAAGAGTTPSGAGKRLDAVEDRLKLIAEAGKSGGGDGIAGLTALTGRIADLDASIEARITAAKTAIDDSLARRIAGFDRKIADGLTTGTSAAVAISSLEQGSRRLGRDLEAMKISVADVDQKIAGNGAATDALRAEIAAARDGVGKAGAAIESAKSELRGELTLGLKPVLDKIAAVETDLAAVRTSESRREASAERILLTLELGNLKRAIERGAPFARELEQVKALAGADIDLAPIASAAETGLPPSKVLEAELREHARAALDAAAAPDADASFVDRMLAGARTIVRVRRTGDVPGDGPEAVIARIERHVGAGDLAAVMAESQKLGEAPRAALAPWLRKVAARAAVEQKIVEIEEGLKDVMRSGGTP